MDTACDMNKPIGYWVQQMRSSGETIAVKVLFSLHGVVDIRAKGVAASKASC